MKLTLSHRYIANGLLWHICFCANQIKYNNREKSILLIVIHSCCLKCFFFLNYFKIIVRVTNTRCCFQPSLVSVYTVSPSSDFQDLSLGCIGCQSYYSLPRRLGERLLLHHKLTHIFCKDVFFFFFFFYSLTIMCY